jgi:riboflavin synthase
MDGRMFTGIIETTGTIADARPVAGGRRLRVHVGPMAGECALGASISVDGVCLTVAAVAGEVIDFDVITETLSRSTLGGKGTGDRVNLERSLRVGDRLDGHFVQGHVDGTGTVVRVQSTPKEYVVHVRPEPALLPYIIPKGAVTVDGISLTIASVDGDTFSVALVPTTLERTTIGSRRTGQSVNIETDIIARSVVHRLSRSPASGGVTISSLREAGFA